jgi:hypothetical protein
MRNITLSIACAFLCGCGGIAESIFGTIVDGFLPEVYDPSPETLSASRLAFVTSESGDVTCLILDSGNSDPVASVGVKSNGIAAGTSGDLFISTDTGVLGLDADWTGLDDLPVNAEIVRVDGVAADAGMVVVATRTDEGAAILVVDEVSREVVAMSAPVLGVAITGLAVADGTAFAIESPSGEIVAYDITVATPARTPLVGSGATPGEPVALVIGDTGNLFVASADGNVEEIDVETGVRVETLFSGGEFVRPVGLAFDADREHYLLLTTADVVLEINRVGTVVETHESGLVEGATGIAFVGR